MGTDASWTAASEAVSARSRRRASLKVVNPVVVWVDARSKTTAALRTARKASTNAKQKP